MLFLGNDDSLQSGKQTFPSKQGRNCYFLKGRVRVCRYETRKGLEISCVCVIAALYLFENLRISLRAKRGLI